MLSAIIIPYSKHHICIFSFWKQDIIQSANSGSWIRKIKLKIKKVKPNSSAFSSPVVLNIKTVFLQWTFKYLILENNKKINCLDVQIIRTTVTIKCDINTFFVKHDDTDLILPTSNLSGISWEAKNRRGLNPQELWRHLSKTLGTTPSLWITWTHCCDHGVIRSDSDSYPLLVILSAWTLRWNRL